MKHYEMAELCELSYHVSDFSTPSGVSLIHKETENHHVIAIRGTELNLLDMIRNLAWWPRPFGGIDSHAGFVFGWQDIDHFIEMIRAPLKLGCNSVKPVVLTGHSAGGAIALIGAAELIRKQVPIAACVTFGAPRTTDNEDPILESITTQYTHARDPIPSWLGATDYRHINRKFLGGDKSSPWWRKRFIFNGFHGVSLYAQLLKKAKL